MQSIWQLQGMKPLMFRIVWWMIDVGAVGKAMGHGWQRQCAAQLSVHRITINKNVALLVSLGVLKEGAKKGEVGINPSVFSKAADRTGLKMKDFK